MPKDDIDYSNTIIYKIFCIDKTIPDVYIGHTTNFTQRKSQHKICCGNLDNKLKIYNIIRQNGGWNNWIMVEISKYNCKDKTEARIKELYHYEELNSTLNSCPPLVDKSKYFCSICNLQCNTPKSYETHINCSLHKKNYAKSTDKTTKNEHNYSCEKCDFNTCKKTDYTRHFLTKKHKNNVLTTDNDTKNEKKYICDYCPKEYNDRAGLWRHNKTCHPAKEYDTQKTIENDKISNDNLILMLINQCKELKDENKELIEIIKNGTNNTTNSHNKTFNLQFFLNETCKDAMNLMDFVDSIKLQLTDLEKVGKIGYVEGISNIITTNLKALDITQRPIHCTDNKREILYIKDEDKWEKEVEEKNKIRKAIKHVVHKNIKMIQKFKEVHPDCIHSNSDKSDQYNKIIIESMGGVGENDTEKESKIIKNIAKGVLIDKC